MTFSVVIAPVTGVAIFRRLFVTLIGMTLITFCKAMLTLERELRTAVIKAHFLPRGVHMAVDTFLTQLALVDIVVFVAGVAAGWRLPVFRGGLVAVGTFDLRVGVSTGQRIVSEVMIERFHVYGCNVAVPSLVVGMTNVTLLFLDTAVVAAAFGDILGDLPVVMAVHTQLGLSRLLEWHMTRSALALERCMPLDDLAWVDDRIKGTERCGHQPG